MMKKVINIFLFALIALSVGMASGCEAPKSPTLINSIPPQQTPSPTWTAASTIPAAATAIVEPSYTTGFSLPSPTPLLALYAGQHISLTEIKMMDEKNGWGIESSGHAVATEDGGATWWNASPTDTLGLYSFKDARQALALPFGNDDCDNPGVCTYPIQHLVEAAVWYSADQGHSWMAGDALDITGDRLVPAALTFIDSQTGWFLFQTGFSHDQRVYSTLMRSSDGGNTWSTLGEIADLCLTTGILFVDRNTGWLAEDCRLLIEAPSRTDFLTGQIMPYLKSTRTGGQDWQLVALPPPAIFPDFDSLVEPGPTRSPYDPPTLDMVNCGVVKLTDIAPSIFSMDWGCSLSYSGPIRFSYKYLTTDGGLTWHSWLATGNEFFIDGLTGWRLISDTGKNLFIQQTRDGGRSWVNIKPVTWETAKFDFISNQTGWAIVHSGAQSSLVITVDGGISWQELFPVIVK